MIIRFWGVRGSIPTPGKEFIRYGGNTPCVEVRCGDTIIIFDAGTGLKNLGLQLAKEFGSDSHEVHLFISHTHWDHIQGFPFFSYIYMENKMINVYGGHYFKSIEELLAGQMQKEYFPVTLENLPAQMNYYEIMKDPMKINDVTIHSTHLMHPALSLGFRLEYRNRVFVYATDNELFTGILKEDFNRANLETLIKDADVLVAETQYTNEEYPKKIGWGHSTIEGVVNMVKKHNVKSLYTFHHDPYHSDKEIDRMMKIARKLKGKSLRVFAAQEGMTIRL
jgi:phosphoribosyl 1,2-cyclic phosphodiesterase